MSLRFTEEEFAELMRRRMEDGGPHPSAPEALPPSPEGKARGEIVPSEEAEQIALMAWAEMNKGRYPALARLFHIPNGGSRGKAEAGRFKAMGVKPGVPDLFLPVPRGEAGGMFIEMKRRDGGRLSKAQRDWIDFLRSMRFRVEVCAGCEAAIEAIRNYLEGKT